MRACVKAAADNGIECLTLFGFSSENWQRPQEEVNELMRLLRHYLRAETAELHKNNVRLRVIGDRSAFDADIIKLIENAEELTRDNDGITVAMALNYGGRADILQAAQKAQNADDFEAAFEANLMSAGLPDVDLMIRTSGEQRISNFLLWQCAYAEFVFMNTLWPDFNAKSLSDALSQYALRDRRWRAWPAILAEQVAR